MLDQNLILAENKWHNNQFVEQKVLLEHPEKNVSHILDALLECPRVFSALLLIVFIPTLQMVFEVITSLDGIISFVESSPSQLKPHGF